MAGTRDQEYNYVPRVLRLLWEQDESTLATASLSRACSRWKCVGVERAPSPSRICGETELLRRLSYLEQKSVVKTNVRVDHNRWNLNLRCKSRCTRRRQPVVQSKRGGLDMQLNTAREGRCSESYPHYLVESSHATRWARHPT